MSYLDGNPNLVPGTSNFVCPSPLPPPEFQMMILASGMCNMYDFTNLRERQFSMSHEIIKNYYVLSFIETNS